MKKQVLSMCSIAVVILLAGCGSTVSKGVDDSGQAAEVIFPDPAQQSTRPEGSYPNTENLGKLRIGMTKAQVFQLMGVPHFLEGFDAREWDYLLHMPNSDVVCQLKLIYDKQLLVGSVHSQPNACTKPVVAKQ